MLKQDEIGKFFKLHKSLLFFINQKKNLIKGISSLSGFKGPILEKVSKLRDIATKDLDLIDSFIKENPFNLTSDELSIIQSWKMGIRDTFFIVKYDKEYTIFYHPKTKKCYGVLHLNDSFEDMLGPYLPIWVETWIIPFKGKIIYDSIIAPYAISFGGGMRKSIKAEYEEAVLKHGVITSLEGQEEKSTSDEELLRFYMKSEANRERYQEKIEELSRKSPELKRIFYQETGRTESRQIRKELKVIGIKDSWFAVLDGLIIASGKSKQELLANIDSILPEKKELAYIFEV